VDLGEAYEFWTYYFWFLTNFKTNELRNIGKSFHAYLHNNVRAHILPPFFVCIANTVHSKTKLPVVYSVTICTNSTKILRTFKLECGVTVTRVDVITITRTNNSEFNVHGSVHRALVSIIVQQDVTIYCLLYFCKLL
jgi:hypothetical protein